MKISPDFKLCSSAGDVVRSLCLGLVTLCVCIGPFARADESHASLETLEALVAKRSQLRLAQADERRTWEQQKAQWLSEIALLRKERALLDAQAAEALASRPASQSDQEDLLREQERLTQSLQRLRPIISQAEAALSNWPKRLPPSLREALDRGFQRLASSADEASTISDGVRLQTIIALYSEIEKLQHEIHVTREVLPFADGPTREMDVLYIGLARGFAVSLDDLHAAVGAPSAEGWVWQPQPELAPRIRHAIAIQRKETTAQWVDLPFQVLEVEE